MTEYELADLAFSKAFQIQGLGTIILGVISAIGDAVQQYMTVLFAYMAAAHFIGASLENRQAVIFTILYLLWQFWTLIVLGLRSLGLTTTMANINALEEGAAEIPIVFPQFITASSLMLLLVALFASLYFMWTVRHPKTE